MVASSGATQGAAKCSIPMRRQRTSLQVFAEKFELRTGGITKEWSAFGGGALLALVLTRSLGKAMI